MKKKKRKRNKKNKQLPIILIVVLIFMTILLFASGLIQFKSFNNTLNCQVLLDAGHGGYDSGSVFNHYYEKDIALELTLEIGEQLENKGIVVGYTRYQDKSLGNNENEDLKKRVALANQSSATYFISIHTNASENKTARGFEVWCNQQSYALALKVEQAIKPLAYIENRGIMDISKRSLYLIRNSNKKTILIEAGFLESSLDREYLCNEMNRKAFAKQIADAIEIALQQEGDLKL